MKCPSVLNRRVFLYPYFSFLTLTLRECEISLTLPPGSRGMSTQMAGSLADSSSSTGATPITLKEQETKMAQLERENSNLKMELEKMGLTVHRVVCGGNHSSAEACSTEEFQRLKEAKIELDQALLTTQA